ncbi:MAG: hypothetical protein J0L75_10455 [Spirochaetes bacterium]|nr:hypothetical protein [Spirochaetota bacterium]
MSAKPVLWMPGEAVGEVDPVLWSDRVAALAGQLAAGVPMLPILALPADYLRGFHRHGDLSELKPALAALKDFSELLSPEGRSDRLLLLLEVEFVPCHSPEPPLRILGPGINQGNWETLARTLPAPILQRRLREWAKTVLDFRHGEALRWRRETHGRDAALPESVHSAEELAFLRGLGSAQNTAALTELMETTARKNGEFFRAALDKTAAQLREILFHASRRIDQEGSGRFTALVRPALEPSLSPDSLTGSFMTADPWTGAPVPTGMFSGKSIDGEEGEGALEGAQAIERLPAQMKRQLEAVVKGLRQVGPDLYWVSFTVFNNHLWVDEARVLDDAAPQARLALLAQAVREKRLDAAGATRRIAGKDLAALLEPQFAGGLTRWKGARSLVSGRVAGRVYPDPDSLLKARGRSRREEAFLLAVSEVDASTMRILSRVDGLIVRRENTLLDRILPRLPIPVVRAQDLVHDEHGVRFMGRRFPSAAALSLSAEPGGTPWVGWKLLPLVEPEPEKLGLGEMLSGSAPGLELLSILDCPADAHDAMVWLSDGWGYLKLGSLFRSEWNPGARRERDSRRLLPLAHEVLLSAHPDARMAADLEALLGEELAKVLALGGRGAAVFQLWEGPFLDPAFAPDRLDQEDLAQYRKLRQRHGEGLRIREGWGMEDVMPDWYAFQVRSVVHAMEKAGRPAGDASFLLPQIAVQGDPDRILEGDLSTPGLRSVAGVSPCGALWQDARGVFHSFRASRAADFIAVETGDRKTWVDAVLETAYGVRPDRKPLLIWEPGAGPEAAVRLAGLAKERGAVRLAMPRRQVPLMRWALTAQG